MRDFPGGLFHPSDDKQEVAFRYAVEKINANRDILPKSRLSAQIEQIKPQDSFHASKRGEWVRVRAPFFLLSPRINQPSKPVSLFVHGYLTSKGGRGLNFNRAGINHRDDYSISSPLIAVFSTAHNV